MTEENVNWNQGALREIAAWSLLLFTVVFVRHYHYFLASDLLAYGDFGANALQVENAKHFNELLGNYSRWGFHHPGPAIFYWYALFETILPSAAPVAAHMIGVAVLQILLVVTALSMTGRRLGLRSFLPMSLALLSIHLSPTESGLTSVWPPHILVGIFLSFSLSAILVAEGATKALPLFVLCCCLLVHGHVAQPLIVIPVFILAGALWLHRKDHDQQKKYLAISIGIVTVFLLPIMLDLAKGSNSNFSAILEHLREHHGDYQNISVITELSSFLLYPTSHRTAWQNYCTLLLYPAWIVLCWILLKINPMRWNTSYIAIALILIVLAIVWDLIQDGTPYAFNSFFNFSIIYLMALPTVIITSRFLEGARYINIASAAVLVTAWTLSHGIFAPIQDGATAMAQLRKQLDERGSNSVFLTFEPGQWESPAAVANYLVRNGYQVRVEDKEALTFASLVITEADGDYLSRPKIQTIDISSKRVSPTDIELPPVQWELAPSFIRVTDGATLPPLFSIGSTLTADSIGPYVSKGVFLAEKGTTFVWAGKKARLMFQTERSDHNVLVALDVLPFLNAGKLDSQRLQIFFDGVPLWQGKLVGRTSVEFTVPQQLWDRRRNSSLDLISKDATSPKKVGLSDDVRILGVGLVSISTK